MRILQACPYAWDAPGGVQVHVGQLSEHLRRRGHRVLILVPGWRPGSEEGVLVVGRPIRIPFNGSVAPVCPDPRSLKRIGAALRQFRPDVVHVHEPFAPSTSMFAALRAVAPAVATFHANVERSLAVAAFSPLLRKVWNRLAIRLAVSDAAARFAGRYFSNGIRVIPNGADVELFAHAEPADLPAGRRLLFVNRLDPRKGFRVAVRAFEALALEWSDLWLVVAGEGAERSAVRELHPEIRDRVIMLGSVPHSELPPYHAASDLFLAPATGGESFGIVLLEAMAAGLPVVASDIAGYREVLEGGAHGVLVPPGDPEALAAAVRRVLTTPELAERLEATGRERAERFRWEVVAGEVEAAYTDALTPGMPDLH